MFKPCNVDNLPLKTVNVFLGPNKSGKTHTLKEMKMIPLTPMRTDDANEFLDLNVPKLKLTNTQRIDYLYAVSVLKISSINHNTFANMKRVLCTVLMYKDVAIKDFDCGIGYFLLVEYVRLLISLCENYNTKLFLTTCNPLVLDIFAQQQKKDLCSVITFRQSKEGPVLTSMDWIRDASDERSYSQIYLTSGFGGDR